MIRSDSIDVQSPHQPGVHSAPAPAHAPIRQQVPPALPPESGKSHILIWLILFIVAAGIAAAIYWRVHSTSVAAAKAAAKGTPPVPVLVTNVRVGDLPIYLPEL